MGPEPLWQPTDSTSRATGNPRFRARVFIKIASQEQLNGRQASAVAPGRSANASYHTRNRGETERARSDVYAPTTGARPAKPLRADRGSDCFRQKFRPAAKRGEDKAHPMPRRSTDIVVGLD